jgi:hypothetical protein
VVAETIESTWYTVLYSVLCCTVLYCAVLCFDRQAPNPAMAAMTDPTAFRTFKDVAEGRTTVDEPPLLTTAQYCKHRPRMPPRRTKMAFQNANSSHHLKFLGLATALV